MKSTLPPEQPSFDDLGTPLRSVTFTVVDLETTGSGRDAEITEIGAVKVCGGEVMAEFQTLVRPGSAIPAMIQALTGITDSMVATAPSSRVALPSFMDFAAGTVLVAHNAPFDIGFLRRGCEELGVPWRRPTVIDTVALARQVLVRDEVANCKLATLARHFHSPTRPEHRALSDARATVDVLHGLLERVGNLGVDTLEDLRELMTRVTPERRAKRVWAKGLPESAGVYWFEHEGSESDDTPRIEVLYVGKSRNLRRRVSSYFSASEQRARIHEMVGIATRVRTMPCATDLEAEVRELRMIDGHRPRYNRRSRNQHRLVWLKLTAEPFPRLSRVRTVRVGDVVWGPFRTTVAAQAVARCLQDAFGIRECTERLSARSPRSPCVLAELDRCSAPCQLGASSQEYGQRVAHLRSAWEGDVRALLGHAAARLADLVAQERFEEAGELTNRLQAAHATSRRFHRVKALAGCAELVAAAPERGGWAIHVIRHGRLAAAGWARTSQVRAEAEILQGLAETVLEAPGGLPSGSFEEAEHVAAWLESPGVRLIDVRGDWAWPIHCAFDQDRVTELITTGVVGRSR